MIVEDKVEAVRPHEVMSPKEQRKDGPQYAPLPLIGKCVDARHPTLKSRVRVRWQDPHDRTREKWLPCLHEMTVREGDRVLVLQPANHPEPIVIGVVDGFAMRPEFQHLPACSVTLEKDESVRVETCDGQPLLEICRREEGTVVRLLTDDVDLELPGKLRIGAESIELNAKMGGVKIKASDDVVVQGEMIQLN